jgi:hypothetical protein
VTAGFLLGVLFAQSVSADTPSQPDLQPIRRALEESAPASSSIPSARRDGPIFRMRIEAFDLEPAWKERSIVPAYVRPWFGSYHHEHMEMVTPEQFRGATLHPYGVPLGPLFSYLWKTSTVAHRAAEHDRVRDEVRRDLTLFRACRADSSKPGCTQR